VNDFAERETARPHKLARSSDGALIFDCPACGCAHSVYVNPDVSPENGATWTWNFSLESPTFSPSLLVRYAFSDPAKPMKVCHSFIRAGWIEYLADCTHSMAGSIVEMEAVE
jgi:hypothetical protein